MITAAAIFATSSNNSRNNKSKLNNPQAARMVQQQQQVQVQVQTIQMQQPLDTRTHVVGELYDTERSYVESLQILVEKYMRPLKNQDRQLIDHQLVDEIFYTIPQILEHHEAFLAALSQRLSNEWDSSQVIGDVFIEAFANQQIIDTYTAFMNNWKSARHAIKVATQTKPAFERYLEAMSRGHRNKLTLDALLIMPVQRIPRYELLLKELIKHTPDDHDDYGLLLQAQREIHQLALKIDRAEREMMHQEQLRELESLIEGHVELQHPQRDFIRYDLVTIHPSSSNLNCNSTASISTHTSATNSATTTATPDSASNAVSQSIETLTQTAAAAAVQAVASSNSSAKVKERLLFLFCDLLIMTSVKKKASRRFGANLQAALAEASSDLSLLEGNKFKLLLRVPLDQVEVRLTSEQIRAQLQRQLEQNQLQVQRQLRVLRERQRELESDLSVLHQMEQMNGRLATSEATSGQHSVNRAISESIKRVRERMNNLSREQDELMSNSGGINQFLSDTFNSNNNTQSQPSSHWANGTETSPNTSLEFVITTTSQVSSQMSSTFTSNEHLTDDYLSCCESQVVTFASLDRLQAFLSAFNEAKRRRKVKQQQQQQKMYSTTAVLRMSHPGTPEHARARQQGNQVTSRVASSPIPIKKQVSSGGHHHVQPQTAIVHQMSAPQSLAMSVYQQQPQVEVCGSCVVKGAQGFDHQKRWLTHQPKSQPASLDTYHLKVEENQQDLTKVTQALSPISRPTAPRFLLATPMRIMNGQHPALQFTCSSAAPPPQLDCQEWRQQTLFAHQNQANQLWLCMSNGYVSHVALILLDHPASAGSVAGGDKERNKLENNKVVTRVEPIIQSAGDICKSHINCISQVSWIKRRQRSRRRFQSDRPSRRRRRLTDSATGACAPTSNEDGRKPEANDSSRVNPPLPELKATSPPVDIDSTRPHSANNPPTCERRFLSESAPSPSTGEQSLTSNSAGTINVMQLDGSGKDGSAAQARAASASTTRLEVPPRSSRSNQLRNNIVTHNQQASDTIMHQLTCHRYHYHHPSNYLHNQQSKPLARHRCHAFPNADHHNSHHHHHHHHHHHNHQHSHGHHHLYGGRHHTVPLGELHKMMAYQHQPARERKGSPQQASASSLRTNERAPADATAVGGSGSIGEASRRRVSRSHQQLISDCQQATNLSHPRTSHRATTPPAGSLTASGGHAGNASGTPSSATSPTGKSGVRSARSLRHQASLKTSSILAKLVSSAGRKSSSYLRKATTPKRANKATQDLTDLELSRNEDDDSDSDRELLVLRTNDPITNITTPGSVKCHLDTSQTSLEMHNASGNQNQVVVSPLSSVSSLASTNSSMTVNSVCVSSPNHSSCDLLLAHSHSAASCCSPANLFNLNQREDSPAPVQQQQQHRRPHLRSGVSTECRAGECAFRSRSATVPSRDFQQRPSLTAAEPIKLVIQQQPPPDPSPATGGYYYKVSEIEGEEKDLSRQNEDEQEPEQAQSSLWLGCDDGSLLVIDCLASQSTSASQCNLCPRTLFKDCNNQHTEIKLGSPICDIKPYRDRTVFVALANGQLATISRIGEREDNAESDDDGSEDLDEEWQLGKPRILDVSTAGDEGLVAQQRVSKLCITEDTHLWFSHGRNIYVLRIDTLQLETTISVSANDLHFTTQSISSIDQMQPMPKLACVCVSLKNSHSVQVFDGRYPNYKQLLEVNLFDPINRMLSYGSDLVRQHKTSQIKVTTLMSLSQNKSKTESATLFVGTSAGIVLYLSLTRQQLDRLRELPQGKSDEWRPQIASLRHGHSGSVRLLHLIEQGDSDEKRETFLVSGGSGLDLYGPTAAAAATTNVVSNDGAQQQVAPQSPLPLQLKTNDEDSLNHLILWQM